MLLNMVSRLSSSDQKNHIDSGGLDILNCSIDDFHFTSQRVDGHWPVTECLSGKYKRDECLRLYSWKQNHRGSLKCGRFALHWRHNFDLDGVLDGEEC